MSMGKFIAFIAIIASILIPQSAFSDDAVYRTIPFYNLRDPDQKSPKLQLKVKEKVYPPDAVYTLPEMLERAKDPFKTPEDNLLGYIGYAAAGKVKETERFYYPGEKNVLLGMTPVQLLKFTIEAYKGLERVRLLRSWHYGNHWKIMVERLYPTRKVSNIALLSFKKIGDKYYKTLGQGGIVSRIFSHIRRNYRKGVGDRFVPVELPYSLTYYAKDSISNTIVKENPATLYFTGKAYAFEDGWVPIGDVDPVLKFVHDAMTIANKGTDEEFLALFTGKTKEYMEMLLELYRRKGEITNMTFRSYKYEHSGEYMKKDIKHIFTLDLGSEYVHYYQLKGESELRYMIIGNKGGKLWLTVLKDNDMPDDTMTRNIKKLIKDENLLNKIIEIWQTKNKKEDNEQGTKKIKNNPQ